MTQHTNTCCNLLKEIFPYNFPIDYVFLIKSPTHSFPCLFHQDSDQLQAPLHSLCHTVTPALSSLLLTLFDLRTGCHSITPLRLRVPHQHPGPLLLTMLHHPHKHHQLSFPHSFTLDLQPECSLLPPPPLCAYLSQTLFYWGPWNAILAKLRPN